MKSIRESIIGRKSTQPDPFKFIEKTWGKAKYLKLMDLIEEVKMYGKGKAVNDDEKWKELFTYILRNNRTLLSKDFSDIVLSYFEEAPYGGWEEISDVFAEDFKNSNWEAMTNDILLYIDSF